MPKEIIRSKYWTGDPGSDLETTYLHLGWEKDREHVEISTIAPDGKVYAKIEHLDSEPRFTWEEIVTDRPGWFMQLDRSGINRLITALRTARDQAFGADA